MRILLTLVALLVPRAARGRWREEWLAELQHGGPRMLPGALPDAWAMRKVGVSAGKRRWTPFQGLGHDLRYGFRSLATGPGFVLGVVLSLTLGIGGNIVAFSFINAAVFRPFPGVQDQHELARVTVSAARDGAPGTIPFLFATDLTAREGLELLRGGLTTLTGLSAHYDTDLVIAAGASPFSGAGALVSSNYFDVLGVRPAVGRFFSPVDDKPGAEPVSVISYRAWQRLFNGSPSAVGSTITVNGRAVHVSGVAAEGFIGVRKSSVQPDVWIPLGLAELALRDSEGRPARFEAAKRVYFDYVGRRKPGAASEHVSAEAALLAARLQVSARTGLTFRGSADRVWLNDPADSASQVVAFMIIPIFVLVIACVNAANLLLARAARQTRDWTVRLALGASRWRIIRQVLVEATGLTLASAVLGLLVASWTIDFVSHRIRIPVPMPIDLRVAAYTLMISLGAAVGFSLGPALTVLTRASKRAVANPAPLALPRSRGRVSLVAVQAALSLGLLTTGAQFINTVFAENSDAARIPAPERLVLASFDVGPFSMSRNEADDFYQRLASRARQIPGVSSAGFSTPGLVTGASGRTAPLRAWTPTTPVEGSTELISVVVSPGALEAIEVPLIEGRHFESRDDVELRSVIVNPAFAEKFFNGRALGRTFTVRLDTEPDRIHEVTIVGVAGGIMKRAEHEPPIVYHPIAVVPVFARTLYLRIDDTGRFSIAALRAVVGELDARVPVIKSTTLADDQVERHGGTRYLAQAAAGLGLLALLLAAGGLYGVVSYIVSLRRQELGIRLALGAEARAIVVLITRQALTPALIGAAVGLLGAALAGRVIQSNLYGSSPTDLRVFAASTTLLLGVLFVATIVPARRAATINPVDTLRTE